MQITRRLVALVAASALTAGGLSLAAAPAQAAADPRPQQQAADWLIGQVGPNGVYHNALYDFDDYGLGADTAIALDQVGGHDAAVTKLGNALRDNYYNFVTGGSFGPDDLYGGAMGKALVVAQVAGTKPAAYAARVQGDVEDLLGDAAPIAGRITNQAGFDANVFGQAYVARGLTVAGSADAENAVGFLLKQQCNAGFFRQDFSAKDAVDQTCDAGDAATYGDRVGATATAVINLAAIADEPGVGPEVDDAITAAREWLAGSQEDDGSWGANANSTGLAAWALGDTPESVEAAQWLRDHQANDTDACTKIGAAGAGAVAFTQDSLTDARNDGITAGTAGEFQRATSQALVALGRVEAPATPAALALSGPTGYVQGGKAATFKVAGAVAGSRLCVTVGNNYKAGTANGSGALSLGVTLPASTATRTVTVVDANGSSATTTAKILGAKRLVVKPAVKRVRKGKKVRVTVTGLAAGEKVTLRYRGKVVATGTASAKGAFARVVKVGRKTGPAAIAATGQFAPRTGATTIRVVR